MFKSLVGSIVGAAIGLGLHYGIKQSTGETYIWFPVVIGILTGMVGRIVAGQATSNAARYISGFFAGVIALAAIFGIDFIESAQTHVEEFGPISDRVTEAVRPGDREAAKDDAEKDESEDLADDASGGDDEDGQPTGDEASDDDSEGGDQEPAADDAEESSDGSEAKTDEMAEDSASAETSDKNDPGVTERRNAGAPEGFSGDNEAAQKRFAELISKSKEGWYELYMPFVYSGLGVLMAYQLARGFGSTPTKES